MAKTALLIEMIDRLRDHPGLTIAELAHGLGRSERTIYRWLSELTADIGAPVYCKEGGYYLAENNHDHNSCLSAEELVAVHMSLKTAPFGRDSAMQLRAASAWHKIREKASAEKLQWAAQLGSSHSVQVTALQPEEDTAAGKAVENAVANHRRLRITYRSQKSNQIKDYTIDPYALVFRRHSWYVLAHSLEHGRVVQFKLLRFRAAAETGEGFVPPSGFSVDDYFKDSWEAWGGAETVNVRVRFSAEVAAMVSEARRHPTQVTHAQPDGSVIFEAAVSGIEEIAIWVMGFGKEAEALEPPALRSYITDHALGMAALYRKPEG